MEYDNSMQNIIQAFLKFFKISLAKKHSFKMFGKDKLVFNNSGFWILNGSLLSEKKYTVIMSGLGRSGTSMVAKLVNSSGIHIGDRLAIGTYEDEDFSTVFRKQSKNGLISFINDRNNKFDRWGAKLPSVDILNKKYLSHFRNPILIIIFRDVLAIAGRRQVSKGEDLISQMLQSSKEYQVLINKLRKLPYPCLLISYEKALQNPNMLVDYIHKYLGLNPSLSQINNCSSIIQQSPQQYRTEVRTYGSWRGRVELCNSLTLSGWVFDQKTSGQLNVDIYVNDRKITTISANKPRSDVQKDHQLKNINCGFEFNPLEHKVFLRAGDLIKVYISGTEKQLSTLR